jgi:hypothetical protein
VVEEGEYTRRRKQAAKDINQLRREYGRMQQVARIRQRDEANASAAGTSSAPMCVTSCSMTRHKRGAHLQQRSESAI